MSTARLLWAGLLAASAVNVIGVQPAQAEPLTPLSPGEVQYLDQLRRVLSVSHDPAGFRGDGELLDAGRFACNRRAAGFVGSPVTYLSPAVVQLALIYLCPT